MCDQIRDDLVALYDGWWFRATRSTAATMVSSVVTAVPLDVITMSATATAEGSIALSTNTGIVTTTKPGLWLLGWHFAFQSPTTGLVDVLIDATDAAGSVICEGLTDANAVTTDWCVTGSVNATTVPQTFLPAVYTVGTPTIGTARPATFWGVWLGANP